MFNNDDHNNLEARKDRHVMSNTQIKIKLILRHYLFTYKQSYIYLSSHSSMEIVLIYTLLSRIGFKTLLHLSSYITLQTFYVSIKSLEWFDNFLNTRLFKEKESRRKNFDEYCLRNSYSTPIFDSVYYLEYFLYFIASC